MKVTVNEIVEALRKGLVMRGNIPVTDFRIADEIEAHGIEQPSGEPVAWLHNTCDPENGFCTDMRVSFSNHSILNEVSREPLYTAPPSVDALIAEAVAKEREACALACEAVGERTEVETISRAFADHIRARGQK